MREHYLQILLDVTHSYSFAFNELKLISMHGSKYYRKVIEQSNLKKKNLDILVKFVVVIHIYISIFISNK